MAAGKHVACPHVLLNSKAQKIWKVCWSCGKLKEKCSELRETRFLSEQLHKTMLFIFLCQLSFNIPVTLEITSGSQMIKVILLITSTHKNLCLVLAIQEMETFETLKFLLFSVRPDKSLGNFLLISWEVSVKHWETLSDVSLWLYHDCSDDALG